MAAIQHLRRYLMPQWTKAPTCRRQSAGAVKINARATSGVAALMLLPIWLLSGCASDRQNEAHTAQMLEARPLNKQDLAVLNRVSWGSSPSSAAQYIAMGRRAFIEEQLHPGANLHLPPEIADQIADLSISRQSLPTLIAALRAQNDAAKNQTDPDKSIAAKRAYQVAMNNLAHEAATRSLLRDIYASDQLNEQMTWFWFNHFNVSEHKADIRALVGDYEEHAIRPHALGKFRDLLGATVRHPAMLRFLDNDHNAVKHLNENYARELMELHTMGVGSGYSQNDVQELARILTGVGINENDREPKLNPRHAQDYVRDGLFEFNPNRHDYGVKHFLGHTIAGNGMAEVDEALDLIARSPATAHFISEQLALAFVSDHPSPALVKRMAETFKKTDGDIADVMRTMLTSDEFTASLGTSFKDPMHYAISAVRLGYDRQAILHTEPISRWLSSMEEPLYGRETPDGFPLSAAAWNGPGQMTQRFEIARSIGANGAGLFKQADQPHTVVLPRFDNVLYRTAIAPTLHAATQQTLQKARSAQDWNMLFLSSPDFMQR